MSELRTRAQAEAGTDVARQGAPNILDELQGYLDTRKGFIVNALAKTTDPDVFMARILNEVRRSRELMACTRPSLMGAILNCAQLGLEVGPLGHYYLTPRSNKGKQEVVGVIGWKGYLELARRAVPMTIDADDRCVNDFWLYQRGTDPKLLTHPPDDGDRGEVLGYWAAASWSGGHAMQYMSNSELERHAKRYASNSRGEVSGFARTNWVAWCRKTVVRQMSWKLPMTSQMALALETDEAPTYWRDEAGATVTVHTDGRVTEHDTPDPVDQYGPQGAGVVIPKDAPVAGGERALE